MKSGTDPKVLEELWKAPQHWKWGVYVCKEDPRVIVPKRVKWAGWTMNFARPSAFPVLLLIIVLLSAPMLVLASKGYVNSPIWFLTLVGEILLLCLACWYFASVKRY